MTPSDQVAISLRPHLAGFRDHEFPLPDDSVFTEIQSTALTGAPASIIPLATFKEMDVPIFDPDEESAATVGDGHDANIRGAFLTIEHSVEPNLH